MRDMIEKLQDLRHLQWSESIETSGTGGMLLKASEGAGTGRVYYKLSCYDSFSEIYGHECVNELIASRLFELLGIPHVRYTLVHALVTVEKREHETWLVKSSSYRHSTDQKQAFDIFYRLNKRDDELPFSLAERFGWGDFLRKMMIADYLIANRDRHGANIEVVRHADGTMHLAPLFDNGLSFVFSCYGDESRAERFDPLDDVNANNFVGSRSLEENLRFALQQPPQIASLPADWETAVLGGIDCCLPQAHCRKIRDMVEKRWEHYEVLRNR